MRRLDHRPSSPSSREREPQDREWQGIAPRVLIADDDPDVQAIYGSYLSAQGCAVFSAHDGLEAVEKATRLKPDIIVIDLRMPRLNGADAIDRLKHSRRTEGIPRIVLSGAEATAYAALIGEEIFLAKPCPPDLLWRQIRILLQLLDDMPPGACS